MVSYQYCYYLYYREIHLRRFICYYCTLIYDNYIIFIMFYFKSLRSFAFLATFESVRLWYL